MSAKNIGTAVAVVALATAIACVFLFRDQVDALRQWLTDLGAWGVLLFVGIYVGWMLTTVPTIPLMSAAGLMYGPWKGVAVCLASIALGASATYFAGRAIGRAPFDALAERHDKMRRVLDAIERRQVLSVAMVRLAPVFPLNLLNYGLGALGVRYSTYLAVTMVMAVPGTALYAGIGEAVAAQAFDGGIPTWLVPTLVVLAAVTIGLGVYVKRRFDG